MSKCKTTEEFIKDANIVHGDKFDYSLVNYEGCKSKITIMCSNGHTFTQSPNDHLNGHGCKKCSGWGEIISNPTEFISRAINIHGNIYSYEKSKYINHDLPLIIICKKHGEFKQTPKGHLIKKYGCQKCGYEIGSDKLRFTKEKFIEESRNIHRGKYDYSNFKYINYSTPSYITCKKHGDFLQTPKDHIHQSQGCNKCNLSKGESLIQYFLLDNNICYETQKTFSLCVNPLTNRKLAFDFFIPSINTCVEFDGIQHSEESNRFKDTLKQIQYRDNLKNIFCE